MTQYRYFKEDILHEPSKYYFSGQVSISSLKNESSNKTVAHVIDLKTIMKVSGLTKEQIEPL